MPNTLKKRIQSTPPTQAVRESDTLAREICEELMARALHRDRALSRPGAYEAAWGAHVGDLLARYEAACIRES